MTLLLIVLLIVLLFGGGWGWQSGYVTHTNPLGLVLLVILIVILLGLVLPYAGYRWYP